MGRKRVTSEVYPKLVKVTFNMDPGLLEKFESAIVEEGYSNLTNGLIGAVHFYIDFHRLRKEGMIYVPPRSRDDQEIHPHPEEKIE